jgi:hydroxymethylbilane synthase
VLDHAPTRLCVEAERAMNRALHGSCHVPVAAFAERDGAHLVLAGLVGSVRDGHLLRAGDTGDARDPESLGRRVAAMLLDQGAGALIADEGEPDTGPFRS